MEMVGVVFFLRYQIPKKELYGRNRGRSIEPRPREISLCVGPCCG
jgi:hypothetical protein